MSVEDYRMRAQRALPDLVWAFIEGAADDRVTVDANREVFSRWSLRTRVLTGCEAPQLAVDLAGERLSLPVLLAPTGGNGLVHWTGELGAAQAAERAGTRAILSTVATYSIEEVAAATAERHLFQVFPWSKPNTEARELTSALMSRAARNGYAALMVTVDVPVLGNREWERRRGIGVPPVLTPRRIADVARRPRWLWQLARHQHTSLRSFGEPARQRLAFFRPDAEWDAIAWIREEWPGPLLIKGVLSADDAERAVGLGVDGIVVSNHGGRQLDGAVASLDALREVAARVGGQAEIVLDGGIRRGTDVIKALCLGATAVSIGRPYLYGLAVDGSAGVEAVLEILRTEITRALTLMGVADVRELDESWLVRATGR